MIPADRVLKRNPSVRYRIVGSEGVIVRQDTAEVIALNDVGARVLDLVGSAGSESVTFGDVRDAMLDEYDVAQDVLEHDLEQFVTELTDAGVLELVRS